MNTLDHLLAHSRTFDGALDAAGELKPQVQIYVTTLFNAALGKQSVLEIGAGPQGVSGIAFAHAMSGVDGALLISIDIEAYRPPVKARELVKQLGVEWTVLNETSLTAWRRLQDREFDHLQGRQFDVLYIDGSHEAQDALADWANYEPLVKPGGWIIVDDFPCYPGVVEAVTELKSRGIHGSELRYDACAPNGHMIYVKPPEGFPSVI